MKKKVTKATELKEKRKSKPDTNKKVKSVKKAVSQPLDEETLKSIELLIAEQEFIDQFFSYKDETYINLPILNHVHVKDIGLSLSDYIIYLTILAYNIQGELFAETDRFWELFFGISNEQVTKSLKKLREISAIEYVDINGKRTGKNKPNSKRQLIANDIGIGGNSYRNEDLLYKDADLKELDKEKNKYARDRKSNIKKAIQFLLGDGYNHYDILLFDNMDYKEANIEKYNIISNSIAILELKVEDLITHIKKKKQIKT